MRNRYGCWTAMGLFACLSATPACAEALESSIPEESAPFRIASAPSLAGIAPEHWDLDDIARAERGAVAETRLAALPQEAQPAPAAYGPPDTAAKAAAAPAITDGPPPHDATGHVPREYATHRGFFRQAGSVGTELGVTSSFVR